MNLIGIPYRRGAIGGDAIDCWNLVRAACEERHGAAPPLLVNAVAPVIRGAERMGWRRVDGKPREGDILLMRTAAKQLHTGFVVRAQHRLEMLHAIKGGSVRQPLGDLPLLGFHGLQVWRLS